MQWRIDLLSMAPRAITVSRKSTAEEVSYEN